MRVDHRKIIELIAMEIYHKFPDRQDRRLSIGDNTPRSGACAGHPGNSHAGCCTMDINYYTLGPTNSTHARPGKKGDACYELTAIWKGDGWIGNDPNNLLEDVFDWERNYYFIEKVKDFFPACYFMTNTYIKEYIMSEVKQKYGYDVAKKFSNKVGEDTNPLWKHSHHCHIALGKTVVFSDM